MEQTWIVVDIGCIECGENSDIVGVYVDEALARAISARLNQVLDFTGGQHHYEVFEAPQINDTKADYREYLSGVLS